MNALRSLPLALVLLAAAVPSGATAAKAHEHGVARVDIAVERGAVTVSMDTPLDNLIGFERAPRTDAEKKAADAAVSALKAGETLWRIDSAARCRLAAVELRSAPLGQGKAAPAGGDGHADLEAEWRFDCQGALPGFVELGLFEAFKRLTRLEVQVVTPKGQAKAVLKRPNGRVNLLR